MRKSDRRKRDRKRHAKSCEGKRAYRTKTEAMDHVFQMRRDKGAGRSLRAYDCAACGKWHVGNRR